MTYAGGVAAVQACWVVLLLLPGQAWAWGFGPLAVAELAVPAVAERVHPTPWHPGHIGDRYGAFTIIVLGESISAATVAVQSALDRQAALAELLPSRSPASHISRPWRPRWPLPSQPRCT